MKIYVQCWRLCFMSLLIGCLWSAYNLVAKSSGDRCAKGFASMTSEQRVPKRPLNILCVVECFPLLPETFIVNQLKGFIEMGHNLTIFSDRRGQEKMHPDVIKYNLLEHTYYGELPPDMASFDIILCQFGPLGNRFVKIKKQLGLKAKVITCFRGYDLSREINENGRGVYKSLFAEGDLFLPVCEYFAYILKDLGCDPEKIIVHHSAIDVEHFPFRPYKKTTRESEIVIVSVNRLVLKKGTCYAIKAVGSLLQKYPNIQYSIMGDGPLKKSLNKLIAEVSGQFNIRLLGWGTHEDVAQLLQTADMFLLPSITAPDGNQEGIPNALKEAMAVGIPVISTPSAGIAELVSDGKTGFLVPCGDSKVLAKKIEYLINNPEERLRIAKAARKLIEKEYETRRLNARLIEIFYNLLGMY